MDIQKLRQINPNITIKSVFDPIFKDYGRILGKGKSANLLQTLNRFPIPVKGNIYVADSSIFHHLASIAEIQTTVFGTLPIEAGYCNGHSYQLNCFEWHNSPEVNLADHDIGLFLAHSWELDKNNRINSGQAILFVIPKGTLVEIYGTTMHFAPIRMSTVGFRCLVVLLKGINSDLATGIHSPCLFKCGKWLITHPENERFVSQGAVEGICGQNLSIKIEEES